MDKIGNLLKQRRLEMGLTIEEVSEKTRLTIKHIKAIEDGDISYFKEDLSYLRFFMKAYCEALDLDFDAIKDELRHSIDDYTTSFDQAAVAQHEQIEKGVQETTEKLQPKKSSSPKSKKPKKAKRRKKVDVSLLSFLAIVIVVLIGLIFAFVMWVQNDNASDEDLSNNKPPVAAPAYSGDPQNSNHPSNKEPEKKKEMVITKEKEDSGTVEYTIENLSATDEVDVEITFGSNSSFRALVDDKELSDPAKQTYSYKTVIHVREKADAGKRIQLAFGFMLKNSIKVNGQEVEIPESLYNKSGSALIEFTVKGE